MKEILADIITIGDEILYGQTIDTNSAFIGQVLGEIGISIHQINSVQDKKENIIKSLRSSKSDITIITGGLGPTKDDITKQTLADFFDDSLQQNEIAWENVQNFYKTRNRTISDINKLQSFLPTKAICLTNNVGTASGMWFNENNKVYISLPGVPREMKKIMQDEVIPRLQSSFNLPHIEHRFVNTVGIPESNLAEKIDAWSTNLPQELSLAYLPSLGCVKLRLTAKGSNKKHLNNLLTENVNKLIPLIEKYVYATNQESFIESISKLLKNNNLSISTAESCTGGNIAKTITSISGSSSYFQGSIVSYSNEVKIHSLGVNRETIKQHGAVSEETAIEMVEGCYNLFKTDICIATTGIAGPDGGTPEKPIGTVYIVIKFKNKIISKRIQVGDLGRNNNIESTTIAALNMIRKIIS